MNLRKSLTAVCLTLGTCYSYAQQYKPAVFTTGERLKKIGTALKAVDSIYKDFADRNHAPGLVYGVVLDGKLVHTGQIGYASLAMKTLASGTSDFRVASMTKSLVGMAILKLRD